MTFNASGTFADGSTLSGTVIIDTSTGNGVLGGSLTIDNIGGVSGDDVTLTGDIYNEGPLGGTNTWYAYEFDNGDSAGDYYLDLYIPAGATTLNGYTGGKLCSTTTSCNFDGPVYTFFGKDFIGSASYVDLTSGSLSTGSGAPEPSSIALILGSVAALAAVRRRKRRA